MKRDTTTSSTALPTGDVQVAFEFRADKPEPGAGGVGKLFINGQLVGEARIEKRVPFRNSGTETFDLGENTITPAGDYKVPFRFTGKLEKLTIDLK